VTKHRYANPPIVEAVCEFRFEPGDWDNAMPGLIWEKVKEPFSKRRDVHRLDVRLVPGPNGAEQRVTQEPLLRYLRDDEKVFMQVGPSLLSVHHLGPYSSWEEFKPLIEQGFRAYCGEAMPKGIQRIGLRYINRVEFPGDRIELEEYFEFRPFVGSTLPEDHKSFILGAEFPYEGERDVLRLQVASTVPQREQQVALILDLDYFTAKPNSVPAEEVGDRLEQAHDRIEEVFEGCIKAPLRSMFGEVK